MSALQFLISKTLADSLRTRNFSQAEILFCISAHTATILKKIHLITVISIVLYCSLFFVQLKATPYTIRNYSTSEGLSHFTINCIMEDRHGFMWVGTSDGLNRFDGYSFKKFYTRKNDSLSLDDNNVTAMAEDSLGRIWLCTGNGFYSYSTKNDAFKKVPFTNGENCRLAESICVDDDGLVWGVENNNMLAKINATTNLKGSYIKLDSILRFKEPLYNKKIIFADGYLWIFSSAGIVRFNKNTMHAQLLKTNIKFESPRTIRKGKPGEILILDWHKCIYTLNTNTLTIRPFLMDQMLAAQKDTLDMTDVQYNSDGSLWVMKYPGIYRMYVDGRIDELNTQNGYEQDYDKLIYFTSLCDSKGNLWLGTQNEGLIVLSENDETFEHISTANINDKASTATDFIVNGNELLFCNLSGAFYCEDIHTKTFKTITSAPVVKIAKANNSEYIIFEDKKITLFNKATKTRKILHETFYMQNGIVDSRGILWITHWESGLEGYDPKTKKHFHIDVDTVDKSLNVVFTLFEDTNGGLWLGTFGSGLQYVKNPTAETPEIKKYVRTQSVNSLSNNFITSLYDDGDSLLWIGTNGGGLNCFDKQDESFTAFTTGDGLRGNVIQSIVADKEGNIWFTANVLSKYNKTKNSFEYFDKSDGLNSKFFTLKAQASENGSLYFGDDKGILTFQPGTIKPDPVPLAPFFTSLRLFGQEVDTRDQINGTVPLPHSVLFSDTLVLPHHLNSFSLEFASIQLLSNSSIKYAYRLEGVDNQWIPASAERLASYAGLPHGSYELKVRASNDQYTWSQIRSIHIIIRPAWWETLWFKLGSLMLAIILLSGGILVYIRNLRKRNTNLEKLVQNRTQKLQFANDTLKDERLVIEMKNKHLNDALESKEKLMRIVAHDFKSPLTAILGYTQLLEAAAKKLKPEVVENYAGTISTSVKSLVDQMVSLLNWSISEDENLQAKPVEINAEVLLGDAISLVKSVAAQKNITIETQNDCTTNILIDPQMGSMIFRNILSNAIKFTPAGGAITALTKEYEKTVEISFIDNGIGIKAEIIEQLLNTDTHLEPTVGTANEKGTGFGLRMSKRFLDKNNGTLRITSAERQGSVFTLVLPKGHTKAIREATAFDESTSEAEITEIAGSEKNRVLVVDDDEETNKIITAILSPHFEIENEFDGKTGVNKAIQIIPDIIISDISMAGMNGIELCKILKQNKQTMHIPVLLISSHSDEETKNSAFLAGANDYIEKPFNQFHLLKKVESVLLLKQKMKDKIREELAKEAYPDMPDDHENEVVRKANRFVEDNLNIEKLNTNVVASELGISRAHLWRIYKSETGISLGDYIKGRKLQKASALLLTGKYRIADIAYELGYASPRYFSRWFAKECGMTPSQYIGKMGKQNT